MSKLEVTLLCAMVFAGGVLVGEHRGVVLLQAVPLEEMRRLEVSCSWVTGKGVFTVVPPTPMPTIPTKPGVVPLLRPTD